MSSEGVGSYWPFATGRRVDQANLLLRQFRETTRMWYTLIPNQHIGAWQVGFMPQWITRDYLARRAKARFEREQLFPARCALLGYALNSLVIEGQTIPQLFLQVDRQLAVGEAAYDQGAEILQAFFEKQLKKFYVDDLDPLGKRIIDCALSCGSVADYEALIEAESTFEDVD